MDIVKMERNCLGDTRTATHMPTRKEFREANWSHKDDVLNLAVAFSTELRSRVGNHDWTKVQAPYDEMFYELMKSTIEDGADFMDGEWARLHYDVLERHHLSRHCPSDVTLFDVLEMLFDCVSAGMTRSGSVYPIEISNEILQKAVSNTVDYLVEHVKVVDRKTEQTEPQIVDWKDEMWTEAIVTEPTISKMEQVEDEPQNEYPCEFCRNSNSQKCEECKDFGSNYEPQTKRERVMKFKEYEMPDGRKAVFEYDENGVGKITLEYMDMLMGQLIAYKRCIQSRSFWDGEHCDGCMFYDDCPFNPREDEDEPQTEEPKQTDCPWK